MEYTKQNNKTIQKIRKAQADQEKRLMKQFKTKPKAFYSYVRSKQKVKSGISQLESEDGELSKDDFQTANILNNFFQSVYTNEPDGDPPSLAPRKLQGEHVTNANFMHCRRYHHQTIQA